MKIPESKTIGIYADGICIGKVSSFKPSTLKEVNNISEARKKLNYDLSKIRKDWEDKGLYVPVKEKPIKLNYKKLIEMMRDKNG